MRDAATPLRHPIVLFGNPTELTQLLFHEPPLHPECATYASKACPAVAGQLTKAATGPSVSQGRRGKQCFDPGCDCGGWVPDENAAKVIDPHPWYAVYASNFRVATAEDGEVLGALVFPEEVLVVRLVSRPGEGRCWTAVPDALDGYEPPDMRVAR